MSGLVVSLCDRTGNMVRPWAEAGYDCLCLDTAHGIRRDKVVGPPGLGVGPEGGTITYRWADVRGLVPQDLGDSPRIVFAFPPCTNLAVSGARDFRRKGMRGLIDGLELVESCRLLAEFSRAPWMIENPVSRLSSCWRPPDRTFQPWEYGEDYTKRTCLWYGGGFIMPEPTTDLEPDDVTQSVWLMSPGPDRADLRAVTPEGFARAVFAANTEPQKGADLP